MKTHNIIKNKTQVNAKELAYFAEQKVPRIQRVRDGAWFVNKKLVSQYRQRSFFKMIDENSFRQPRLTT